ncbi:neurotrypsin-like [Diadema antillarum]|uniref:neurotrypsin-like n=1 Tax=Diadema antillarum TaxID=105358 RepID=UPI003A887F8E
MFSVIQVEYLMNYVSKSGQLDLLSWCGYCCSDGSIQQSLHIQTIRLVNGESELEGRVEVLDDGEWGTVCDDFWGIEDATVVCQSLGFGGALEALSEAHFGEGEGSIVLDNVECSGSESTIIECEHNGIGIHNCFHFEDAGVRCFPKVRLVGGESVREGRVEIQYEGEWGTVCDDDWDMNDANVVCRNLGFEGALEALSDAYFGEGEGSIFLDNVDCSGNESSIIDCEHPGIEDHNCLHFEDAGVRCTPNEVRLVGGESIREGRVEILYDGEWGTVCDDDWDIDNANVVCQSLGFEGAIEAKSEAHFGEGEGSILLDDVECSGSESTIIDCEHPGIGDHNCLHYEDAGVRCSLEGKRKGK